MSDPTTEQHSKFPPAPARGTEAAGAYLKATHSDSAFFHFIVHIVLTVDHVAYLADPALTGKQDDEVLDAAELAKTNPGSATKFLRKNRQALLEMFLSRLVDNFQKYLVDLIRTVLRARPAMLSTSQQSLTLEDVLGYSTIDDLVHDVIERKVNSLSYEGFPDLYKWCVDRGIPIQVSDSDRNVVVELIATRNVIAHNRGLIDDRYLRAVTQPRFQIGTPRTLSVDDLSSGVALFHRVVFDTDDASLKKFGLSAVEIGPPTGGESSS